MQEVKRGSRCCELELDQLMQAGKEPSILGCWATSGCWHPSRCGEGDGSRAVDSLWSWLMPIKLGLSSQVDVSGREPWSSQRHRCRSRGQEGSRLQG